MIERLDLACFGVAVFASVVGFNHFNRDLFLGMFISTTAAFLGAYNATRESRS